MYTSHSLWPCKPSKSRFLTATDRAFKPGLGLSSLNPLGIDPNPPSPRKLLGEIVRVRERERERDIERERGRGRERQSERETESERD